MGEMLKPSMSWLLVFFPATVLWEIFRPEDHTFIFVGAAIAIVPLAGWLGRATEQIAHRAGEGLGGFLNATFGNAAELVISIMALREGLTDMVKASLTGSIIGNVLLVLGAALLAGGAKHSMQEFNAVGARSQATMLTLAVIAFIAPSLMHQLVAKEGVIIERNLSLDIAIVLLVSYGASLLFSLRTHKELFSGTKADGHFEENVIERPWKLRTAIIVLAIATALIAWISEILVGSVTHAAEAFGMSTTFVGVIIVAVVGNAAEHSTAILVALKNRMDLSLGIAIGSSVQIAVFAAPILVLLSYVIGPAPIDLVFTSAEVLALAAAVIITGQVAGDGKSNWFEGVQLLTVYVIFGLMFYFLPT